jgi:hypothetical protein
VNALLGEAWRDVITGQAAAFVFAAAFALTVGALAVIQARMVVGFTQEATAFEASGAATTAVSLTGSIDGAQCDALATYKGIAAAGAIREGPQVTLAAMPSTQVTTTEATAGFGQLLDLARADAVWADGVWLSGDLAAALGASAGEPLALADGRALRVDGVYSWPDDGRTPSLAYQIISPVAPLDAFDECWVLAWPDPAAFDAVSTLAVAPELSDASGSPGAPRISQVNTALGAEFDPAARFAALPSRPLALAGLAVGATLGFTSIRRRRLELASALHSGVSKTSLAWQVLVETTWWLVLAVPPALAASLWASQAGNSADWWPAFFPAARTLVVAGAASALGSLVAVAATRERHLFRYFKAR